MRAALTILVVVGSFSGAKLAREAALVERGKSEEIDEPLTISQTSAPFVSLAYRELFADLLYVRLRGYYGGYYDTTADRIASLAEAIVTLDPKYERVYNFGANAMTIAPTGVDQSTFVRAIALLERGIAQFPESYQLPLLAGQMYLQDLVTDDPAQRRAWDEQGVRLVESAIRKPKAPLGINAEWVASIRTRLGQRERAVQNLRELLLIANDPSVRKRLVEKLAQLADDDSTEIAAEVLEMRKRFEGTWKAERPAVKPSMYILVGKPLGTTFDLAELATGGRDLIDPKTFERLEPLVDAPQQPP